MIFAVGSDEQLFDLLRRGSKLTIAVAGAAHEFALSGTSASLSAVRACVDKARQLAGEPTGPQAARGTITREALSKLFQQAGLQNVRFVPRDQLPRSEEHTSELQSLMRSSYASF